MPGERHGPNESGVSPRRPGLFIVGGPKCGTTSLAHYLGEHSQVFMCTPKEPTFFNTDFANRLTVSLASYREYFRFVPREAVVVGEASPLYLASNAAVRNILEFNPDARFVAMVRNPIEMAYSLHSQKLRDNVETIDDFARAWRAQEWRAAGARVPAACRDVKVLLYGFICRLGEQVERLIDTAGAGRVHIVVFDDLQADPRGVYGQVLRFLGLDDDHRRSFEVLNANAAVRSVLVRRLHGSMHEAKLRLGIRGGLGVIKWLTRENSVVRPRAPLPAALRQQLADYFRADVERLGRLLGRPLAKRWLAPRDVA